jgi:hypothetical protein
MYKVNSTGPCFEFLAFEKKKLTCGQELYKSPLQFFRTFRPKLNQKKSGRFVVKGGVGFWEDMWITIEKRKAAV